MFLKVEPNDYDISIKMRRWDQRGWRTYSGKACAEPRPEFRSFYFLFGSCTNIYCAESCVCCYFCTSSIPYAACLSLLWGIWSMEVTFLSTGKHCFSAHSPQLNSEDFLSVLLYKMRMLYYQLQTFWILSPVINYMQKCIWTLSILHGAFHVASVHHAVFCLFLLHLVLKGGMRNNAVRPLCDTCSNMGVSYFKQQNAVCFRSHVLNKPHFQCLFRWLCAGPH